MKTNGLLFAVVLVGAACGGRSLPHSDGTVPDHSAQADAAKPVLLDAGPTHDACQIPSGYCHHGKNECPSGYACVGCYACEGKAYWSCGCSNIVPCSVCSSCIGKCMPNKICATNNDCLPDAYCHLDGLCVVTGAAAGQCKPRPKPEGCPVYDECPDVCGCDGQTYCDACYAHSEGVSVATKAACFASTCAGLEVAYTAEIQKAKQCCPGCDVVQCVIKVPAGLACSCDTMINTTTPGLQAIRDEWLARGCQLGLPPCGIKCAPPMPGSCQWPTGLCIDGD